MICACSWWAVGIPKTLLHAWSPIGNMAKWRSRYSCVCAMPAIVPHFAFQSFCLLKEGPYTWASFLQARRTSQSSSNSPPPNPVHWASRYPVSVGLSCHMVLSNTTVFHSLYFGSAWLARISLMVSSGFFVSKFSFFRSISRRGRTSFVWSCKLASCPQRTCMDWQSWGHGVWSL